MEPSITQSLQAVLWDLDGTIADTTQLHFESWRDSLLKWGIDYSYDEFLAGFGRNSIELLRVMLADHRNQAQLNDTEFAALIVEEAWRKEALYREMLLDSELPMLPGVEDWLNEFKARGIRQVISSSGPMANTASVMVKLGIADYFLALMTGATLPHGKPHPMLFLHSARAVGCTPANALVIGDTLHDIEGARRGGMVSIAVGDLAHSNQLATALTHTQGPACIEVRGMPQLTWAEIERAFQP
ncbi:MAG: HAD family phosphatase [Chloroflexota bacterium]